MGNRKRHPFLSEPTTEGWRDFYIFLHPEMIQKYEDPGLHRIIRDRSFEILDEPNPWQAKNKRQPIPISVIAVLLGARLAYSK